MPRHRCVMPMHLYQTRFHEVRLYISSYSDHINLTYFVLDSVEETALSGPCLAQQAEAKRKSIAVGSRQRGTSSRPETSHAFLKFSEVQWVWLTQVVTRPHPHKVVHLRRMRRLLQLIKGVQKGEEGMHPA